LIRLPLFRDHTLASRDIGGKILEKVVGDLLGRAIDQALAELGELAAIMGFGIDDASVPIVSVARDVPVPVYALIACTA
jgi:hypothetical protein